MSHLSGPVYEDVQLRRIAGQWRDLRNQRVIFGLPDTAEQAEHASLPAFKPFLPTTLLKPVSILFLSLAFVLSFYFTTQVDL